VVTFPRAPRAWRVQPACNACVSARAWSFDCAQVETELEKICNELLDVLDRCLLPEDKSTEGQVFYLKMAGDYYRYLAEFSTAGEREKKVRSRAANGQTRARVPVRSRTRVPPPSPPCSRRRRQRTSTRLRRARRRTTVCRRRTRSAWAWR
jgi:hypothetical protein